MTTLTVYAKLERQVREGDVDALLARWQFGRMLLEERGDAKRLPNGRVEQLYHACQVSETVEAFQTEISRRMRFAEQYPSEPAVRAAYIEHGGWGAICKSGLGSRDAAQDVGQSLRISIFPFMRQYSAMLGRIRSLLRPHSVPYRILWLTVLQRGIEQEIYALDRQHCSGVDEGPTLLDFAHDEEEKVSA